MSCRTRLFNRRVRLQAGGVDTHALVQQATQEQLARLDRKRMQWVLQILRKQGLAEGPRQAMSRSESMPSKQPSRLFQRDRPQDHANLLDAGPQGRLNPLPVFRGNLDLNGVP